VQPDPAGSSGEQQGGETDAHDGPHGFGAREGAGAGEGDGRAGEARPSQFSFAASYAAAAEPTMMSGAAAG
jgi:hypothetical protein